MTTVFMPLSEFQAGPTEERDAHASASQSETPRQIPAHAADTSRTTHSHEGIIGRAETLKQETEVGKTNEN